jgi:hypothetical protein
MSPQINRVAERSPATPRIQNRSLVVLDTLDLDGNSECIIQMKPICDARFGREGRS